MHPAVSTVRRRTVDSCMFNKDFPSTADRFQQVGRSLYPDAFRAAGRFRTIAAPGERQGLDFLACSAEGGVFRRVFATLQEGSLN